MEKRHIIARAHVHDEYSTEMPSYVIIVPEAIDLAFRYREGIRKMKDDGLSPYRVSQFYYGAYWTEAVPTISPDLAKQFYVAADTEDDLIEDMLETETVNTIEELIEWIENNNKDMRLDCGTIDCDENDFHVTCNGKYCGTLIESAPFFLDSHLLKMEDLLQEVEEDYDPFEES